MTKSVTILGGGQSLFLCPYDTEEIWTCNNLYLKVKRMTKLFVIHQQVYDPGGRPHYDWTTMNERSKSRGFDIISLHRVSGLDSRPFPLRSIIKRFGSDYFTNSISYLVAYALYMGFDHLQLYGVDQKKDEHYAFDKGAVEFWLGVAKGMGVTYKISEGSEVCK